jgi:NitT/TauT family transport system substrate-binding protein
MKNFSRTMAVGLLAAMLAVLLSGCAPAPAAMPEDARLRIGLLPIVDVVPLYIADQNGYFKEQGIQVELVPTKSAQERDVLMQTGQIDGVLNDSISTGIFNKDASKIKIVRKARQSYPNAPQYRILASPNSPFKSPADLKGVPIGVSQNSVIQYITDRLLEAQGLAPADIKDEQVAAIPVRYEQLMNGNLKAATLPDPLGQGALAGGAHLVVDDSAYPQYSQSFLSFRTDTLQNKPNTVKKFLAAWEKSIKEINANPEKYQDVLNDKANVPQAVRGKYKMPPFPESSVPSQSDIADVVMWLRDKGLVNRDIPYSEMVDASFLPGK